MLALRKIYSTPPSVHADLEPELSGLVHACVGDVAGRPTAGGLADRIYALVG
ncbi:hypothetical protein [Streptosporangium sp. NBC_01756]|uniref:hypothetical protein n=1 Tax=Streptosporangium sp. NBC_01756 TaxID=2975950 RepID=UPI002DD831AE|nr:hypothetical protein [Streptosporangium sp. NBC_01756]WSC87047.1 hypothetical protein OIE48_02150 [Streptosporangium sp. NBC_01756]